MRSVTKLLVAQLFALACALPLAASAQGACPVRETSIFGTVRAVGANEFTLQTNSRMGDIHVFTRGARMHANGVSLQPGVFAGVYGCLTPGDYSFRASQVTLASSASTYPSTGGVRYESHDTWIQGRVDAVAPGRVLIDSGHGHGDTWIRTTAPLRKGQLIQAVGHFTPFDRLFIANSVTVLAQ